MKKRHFLVKETPQCGKGVFSTKTHPKNKWLNPSKKELGYYVNHSCNPNARFKAPHHLAALRTIRPNQEITLDYSTLVNIPKWDMGCACGEKTCRKIIRSYPKLPLKLQKKYKDIVSFKLSS